MRNIQVALERWGNWAATGENNLGYPHIAAGFKGLISGGNSGHLVCTDTDGLMIDNAIAKLKTVRKDEEYDLVIAHYMYRISKRAIARKQKISEGRVRQMMQVAEGFVDGYLYAAGAALDMDHEISHVRPSLCN